MGHAGAGQKARNPGGWKAVELTLKNGRSRAGAPPAVEQP